MTDELVAYLLDDLSPQRRAEIERRLQSDPAWQSEFNRLRECFAATDDTALTGDAAKCAEGRSGNGAAANAAAPGAITKAVEFEEPPQDLVKRTCCVVEKARECGAKTRRAATAFTAAPAGVGGISTWSLADFTVGGGVLMVLAMLVFPALQESRNAARRATCADNLRALGTGLFQYQDNYGRWLPPVGPGQTGAQYIPALADRVGFSREELASMLLCPDSPEAERIAKLTSAVRVPTYDELDANDQTSAELAQGRPPWAGCYAYDVGYWDDRGVYHFVKYTGSPDQAMLADAPVLLPHGVRSSSHGGRGQNVLDQSLHVGFRSNCDLRNSVDNMFLNEAGRHDAGASPHDTVLIRGDARPRGPRPPADANPIAPIVPLQAK